MTGPEHYREAERLLAEAANYDASGNKTTVDVLKLSAAQVHATLAQAAATALVTPEPADERLSVDPVLAEWWRVAS